MTKFIWKYLVPLVSLFILLIFLPLMIGINQAGYRTVVQWPNGKLFVKFTPGVYIQAFGSVEEYPDVVTFDFNAEEAGDEVSLDQSGIEVRYRDGGTGKIYGVARYTLPKDEPMMIHLHKEARSVEGISYKILKPSTEEAMNLTAGLMTSEDAYDAKRAMFIQMSRDQISKGSFKTKLEESIERDEAGRNVVKQIPVPVTNEAGQYIHNESDLNQYGIILISLKLNNPTFEEKTLAQIAAKREATMGIITAKANAERAKQDAITTEEQGKANVVAAKYEKEVEKERAIVDAKREKEVAEIKASQKVEVAKQEKLEAEQRKLAAVEYKQEQILRGEGEGEYKRLVMEADGALAQKLKTYEVVNSMYAQAIASQKWVPEVQLTGGGVSGDSSAANDLMEMFKVKVAKDLSLDMEMQKGRN